MFIFINAVSEWTWLSFVINTVWLISDYDKDVGGGDWNFPLRPYTYPNNEMLYFWTPRVLHVIDLHHGLHTHSTLPLCVQFFPFVFITCISSYNMLQLSKDNC